MDPAPEPMMEKKEGGTGAIVGTIVVVILIALGGIYFLFEEHARSQQPPIEENLNA